MRIGGFTSSKARHAEDRGASWVLSATDISKGPARVIVRCLESKEDCSNLVTYGQNNTISPDGFF